ncbi:type I restriction endonuclease subunit R [Nanoarchaeota archaeon]|nr:MAG: type I restriction endonuclease subunit R [Nanoarchaeota archaeon]
MIRRLDITYILEPARLLEFLRYFVFYRKSREGIVDKIVSRYNQYYATKKAMKRIDEYLQGGRKNRGLIWHWLGSGKTYTMFFIANYYLDKYFHERPIVFFIVDRRDLEDQHERMLTAIKSGKFTLLFKKVESIPKLHDIIRTIKKCEIYGGVITYGVYLTTIQKFRRGSGGLVKEEEKTFTRGLLTLLRELGEEYLEYLRENKPDEYEGHIAILNGLDQRAKLEYLVKLGQIKSSRILLLIDEAHRTQYGILAAMRKLAFPNALAFGFTGTPIFKHEERNTFQEFAYPSEGEIYLDVYFIRDSIEDGFTLPLVYHAVSEGKFAKEGIRIKLTEEELRKFIETYMKAREEGLDILEQLDTAYRGKVNRYINKIRIFLMNPVRIDKLAKYIVDRIEDDTEGFRFKAMVVAVNRVACVRFKRALGRYLVDKYGEKARDWVEVVMTYNYNDRDREIIEYREELTKRFGTSDTDEINREIQRRFLEEENPRILVVTDMLITGFDAPILKVMYLDKPLYEHRLLQAIARVNRPLKDKQFGLIVDSIGLLEHLSKTMALYNMLAEEDIRNDLQENMMSSIEEKVEEFESLFRDVKMRLRSLRLGGEDVSIDLDLLKEQLTTKAFDREEFNRIIGIIALYASSKESSPDVLRAKRLVNDIYCVIRLYRSLGSHPKKLFYVEDMQVLAFVYGCIMKKIKRKRVRMDKRFWEELVSFIHSKTLIDEFHQFAEAKIDVDALENIVTAPYPRRNIQRAVADYFFYLRSSLLSNPRDPIYREILERLEELRRRWLMRKIDLKTFLAQLVDLGRQKEEYDKRIQGKSLVDKICESIRAYITQNVIKDEKLELELIEIRRTIQKIVKSKRVTTIKPSDEMKLRKALTMDLFREIRSIDRHELVKLADKLVDEFIIPEIEEKVKAS